METLTKENKLKFKEQVKDFVKYEYHFGIIKHTSIARAIGTKQGTKIRDGVFSYDKAILIVKNYIHNYNNFCDKFNLDRLEEHYM